MKYSGPNMRKQSYNKRYKGITIYVRAVFPQLNYRMLQRNRLQAKRDQMQLHASILLPSAGTRVSNNTGDVVLPSAGTSVSKKDSWSLITCFETITKQVKLTCSFEKLVRVQE